MARPLWKGTLGFGVVSIPVEVYTAVRDPGPHLHFLRRSDTSRIGYQKVAKADDEPLSKDELVKGYEYVIDAKQHHRKPDLEAQQPEADADVVDLMERLRRSLGKAAGPKTAVKSRPRTTRSARRQKPARSAKRRAA